MTGRAGLIWLRMEEGDPEAGLLRGLIRKHGGGHATLVRAAPAHRAAVPVFEPQAPHLAALAPRLKFRVRPQAILTPGRMAPGSGSATLSPSTEGAAS